MTYTSVLPPTVAVNAILEPSGEKYGSVSTVGVAVSRRACPPVRATAHRSPAYSNATSSRLTVGWRRRRVPCADAAPAAPNQATVASRTDRAFMNRIEFGIAFRTEEGSLPRRTQSAQRHPASPSPKRSVEWDHTTTAYCTTLFCTTGSEMN